MHAIFPKYELYTVAFTILIADQLRENIIKFHLRLLPCLNG